MKEKKRYKCGHSRLSLYFVQRVRKKENVPTSNIIEGDIITFQKQGQKIFILSKINVPKKKTNTLRFKICAVFEIFLNILST